MAIDFKEKRKHQHKPLPVNPIEIINSLPKGQYVKDLYSSQSDVLTQWFERRKEQDLIIKLHTGGGKTLVGLLIAKSILNELKSPILYLCPTKQLVQQTLDKAREYYIDVVEYTSLGGNLPESFLGSTHIMVATYDALFNGKSLFGVKNSGRTPVQLGGIILDDAHTSFSNIREKFSISITKEDHQEHYNYIANIFHQSFINIDKEGTFRDIIEGKEINNVLEIPYTDWINSINRVNQYIRDKNLHDNFKFQWPFLRDNLKYSHCFITDKEITITTLYPMVELLVSFVNCPRRIYMSATIADDSAIIKTFNASINSIQKPIKTNTTAGISERMILIPNLLKIDNLQNELESLLKDFKETSHYGSIILVPSFFYAQKWNKIAKIIEDSQSVNDTLQNLQANGVKDVYVFSNRYDGMDFPNEICRIEVLDGLPRGISSYEMYKSNFLEGDLEIQYSIAQKIEQGLGRCSRGTGDYSVVFIIGDDLVAWISNSKNLKLLTQGTFAQLQLGLEISKEAESIKNMKEIAEQCLKRDSDWISYHMESISENVQETKIDTELNLKIASIEREVFNKCTEGYDKSEKIIKFIHENQDLSNQVKGWLYQFAARVKYLFKSEITTDIVEIQKRAYGYNKNALRPKEEVKYQILVPTNQATAIKEKCDNFDGLFRYGIMSDIDSQLIHLNSSASASQFEESIKQLGLFLGFKSERLDKKTNGGGSDNLWLMNNNMALILESKSKKKLGNPITKDEFGQLLASTEWLKAHYPNFTFKSAIINNNTKTTENVCLNDNYILTMDNLLVIVQNLKSFYKELLNSNMNDDNFAHRCEDLLQKYRLTTNDILTYLYSQEKHA